MYLPNMQNIKKRQIWNCLFLMFAAILFTTGCSSEELNTITRFSISVNEVADYSASVVITHDGTNRDNYYVFAVKGDNVDVKTEIAKHHASLQTDTSPYDQKKRIIQLNGLSPESTYTCIIYGIDDTGSLTGLSASTLFKTTETKLIFEENPNWSVFYEGQGLNNGLTYSQVVVYVEGDVEERYFICIHEKATVDRYSEIKDFIIYAYNNFVNERNELGDEYFWMEDNYIRTESTIQYRYLYKGTYQAFAIGVDYRGNLTGHYAKSDVFEFERYDLQPEYAEILGDWLLTDETGAAITLTFNEGWANNYFTLSGWGYNDAPFKIYYYGKGIYFYGLYPLTISHQTATEKEWGDGLERTLTLTGWYLREDGALRIYDSASALARATRNDDGSYTFNAAFKKPNSTDEEESTLGILVSYQDENDKTLYLKSSVIQFPFTMKKIK